MIPEKILELIGKPFGTITFTLERESIRRFADAVGETNPIYYNTASATNAGFTDIPAPPGFLSSPWYWETTGYQTGNPEEIAGLGDLILTLMDSGFPQTLDSGIEFEFSSPAVAGDTITASSRIKDIVERGKDGEKAVFLFTETTYTNQNNEIVAVSKTTTTHR